MASKKGRAHWPDGEGCLSDAVERRSSRLLAAAAQGHGSETCQRQQRPAGLGDGSDITHSDCGVFYGFDVGGVDRQRFRGGIPAHIGPPPIVGSRLEGDVLVQLVGAERESGSRTTIPGLGKVGRRVFQVILA